MPLIPLVSAWTVLLSIWLLAPHGAHAQTSTQRIATGISRPVFAVSPTGDTNRLFLAEQHTGRIEILDLTTGLILNTPLLELEGLATGNEQGLLGLAFDPDFANNGHFYVNMTTSVDGGDTHIRRYTVAGDPFTSNVANLESEYEILSYNQPQSNHNGGWIGFSPHDDYLYVASGDGGGGNDDDSGHTAGTGNAQDLTNNLLGKMLRIDVTGDDFPLDATRNYAIPQGNPWVGIAGDDEIWAYGLRNPYRASFDRETGDLWIGDVGQDRKEEIDFQPVESLGGENYGWRFREGTIATPGRVGGPRSDDPNDPNYTVEPIYDYDQLAAFEPDPNFRGNVVVGGYLYRGPVPAMQGHYFFADSGSNNIWKLDPDAIDPRASVTQVNGQLQPDVGGITSIGSFGEDAVGNLYLMEVFGGELFRLTTASQQSVWNGDQPGNGAVGDGISWGSADNWTRGTNVDQSFIDEDEVLLASGSSATNIQLGATRVVSAITFAAPYTLSGNSLQVLSGNVEIATGVTATIESTLQAESVHHSLRKIGPGRLLVDGLVGQMVVKEGVLGGTGTLDYLTVHAGGTVAPGVSIGELQVTNQLKLEPGAILSIDIGGPAIGEFDQLMVDGIASLAGTLEVKLVDGFVPQAGDSFPFMVSQGGAGGQFEQFLLPALAPYLQWQFNPGDVSLFLLVNSTLEGDFDNDGDVDSEDLTLWQAGFGISAGASRGAGDADGDLDVDGSDLLIWQQQLGLGGVDALARAETVPEPATAMFVAVSLMFLVGGRQAARLRLFS